MQTYRCKLAASVTEFKVYMSAYNPDHLQKVVANAYPNFSLADYVQVFSQGFRDPRDELPLSGVQVWVKHDSGMEGISWTEGEGDDAHFVNDGVVGWMYLSEAGKDHE